MAAKLGFEKRKTLKPDAVPTVFLRTAEQKAATPPSKKRCSTEPGSSQALKKARSAFEKRERARVRKKVSMYYFCCNQHQHLGDLFPRCEPMILDFRVVQEEMAEEM